MKYWYVLKIDYKNEKSVYENLKKVSSHLDGIYHVVVAFESSTIIKNGKVKEVIKNVYPGYAFIEADLTPEAMYSIRRVPGVRGFLMSKNNTPTPLLEKDILMLFNKLDLSSNSMESDSESYDSENDSFESFNEERGEIRQSGREEQYNSSIAYMLPDYTGYSNIRRAV